MAQARFPLWYYPDFDLFPLIEFEVAVEEVRPFLLCFHTKITPRRANPESGPASANILECYDDKLRTM